MREKRSKSDGSCLGVVGRDGPCLREAVGLSNSFLQRFNAEIERFSEALLAAHEHDLNAAAANKPPEVVQKADSLPYVPEEDMASTRSNSVKKQVQVNAMRAVARTRQSNASTVRSIESVPRGNVEGHRDTVDPDNGNDDSTDSDSDRSLVGLGPLAEEVEVKFPVVVSGPLLPPSRLGFLPMQTELSDQHRNSDDTTGLELASVWTKEQHVSKCLVKPTFCLLKNRATSTKLQSVVDGDGDVGRGTFVTAAFFGSEMRIHLVLHPDTPTRLLWDTASLLFVLYELVALPLGFFDIPWNGVLKTMDWCLRLFWTCDIIMSLFSGYFTDSGLAETRIRKIWKRYFRTWFLLDSFIVGSDWAELIVGATAGHSAARVGKASRLTRLVRMLRLLRVLRMWRVFSGMLERLDSEKQSETLGIVMNILKITMLIALWSHLIACLWFGIGECHDGICWTHEFAVTERAVCYQYLTSLHWALSQFTGGMDEVRPTNTWERLYGVCTWLVAYLLSGVCSSILTSSMTRLHLLTSGQQLELIRLRRYLRQSGISNRLVARVKRNIQSSLANASVAENSVKFLDFVSRPLRVEMHYEMYSPLLTPHPFFCKYGADYPHIMQQLCHKALSKTHVAEGDVIFNLGEKSDNPKMYSVRSGRLHYEHSTGRIQLPREGSFAAEACLWLQWTHQGTLSAIGEADLLEIDANSFQGILPCYEHKLFDPWKYAQRFLQAFRHSAGQASDIFDPQGVLFKSMTRDVRSNSRVVANGLSRSFTRKFRRDSRQSSGDSLDVPSDWQKQTWTEGSAASCTPSRDVANMHPIVSTPAGQAAEVPGLLM